MIWTVIGWIIIVVWRMFTHSKGRIVGENLTMPKAQIQSKLRDTRVNERTRASELAMGSQKGEREREQKKNKRASE